MTKRLAILTYAILAYTAFLLSVVWAVWFLTDRGGVDGPASTPAPAALAIDGALLLLFAVQHTVMARDGFKRRLARLLPPAAERSTFVLVSSLLLFALFGWWQPVPATIWHVGQPWSVAIWVVYAL